MTHTRYGISHVYTSGQMTNIRCSDGSPELDGALREVARTKILHYRQLYLNRPDPIVFLPTATDTTRRVYDDFSRLLFLHAHREASALTNEIPEESGQFKSKVGHILDKTSTLRINLNIDGTPIPSRPYILRLMSNLGKLLMILHVSHWVCGI